MTMAALTFSHLSSDTFEQESQKKSGRKRPRIREAVSCWQCRSRKIRCDREQPCQPCVERGAGAKCTYGQPKSASGNKAPSTSDSLSATVEPLASLAKNTAGSSLAAVSQNPTQLANAAVVQRKSAIADEQPGAPASQNGIQNSMTRSGPSQPLRGHTFQGSNRKTRLVGVSHWMAPCNEMMVVKALVSRSPEFRSSLEEFAKLKERLCLENSVALDQPETPMGGSRISLTTLLSALPDRMSCEQWIGRYFKGYGRIYDITEPATLATDLENTLSQPPHEQQDPVTATSTIYIMRILATVALGMQLSEPHRLQGRRLGLLVEDFIYRAVRLQKPCIGSVQVLLLLVLLKTVTASDTDGEHDSMSLLGLTSYIVSSMGLHRDPELFDDVPSHYSERRKKLWACFLRLNLAHCIQTGTQLSLRLEDSDCPLPSAHLVKSDPVEAGNSTELTRKLSQDWCPDEQSAQSDAFFGYASARLANILAPIHQTLCSAKPRVTPDQQATMQKGFATLVSELPPNLQSGPTISDPIVELQRTTLSIGMHSAMLILSLSQIFGRSNPSNATAAAESPSDAYSSQRPQLLEIWDCTISILNQFQSICQASDDTAALATNPETLDASVIARHLLWTDAGRAALSACLVVGRLRRQDLDRALPLSVRPQKQHTASIFQQMLAQSLSALLQLWRSKYHLGPVTAKTSLLLAVTIAVTTSLYSDFTEIFNKGVAAADQLIEDMKRDLDQRRSPPAGFFDAASFNAPPRHASASISSGSGTMPGLTYAVSDSADPMSPLDMIPHTAYSWDAVPAATVDSGAQFSDLSGSTTGSYMSTPDFSAASNISGVSSNSDALILDFTPDMIFPYYDTGMPADSAFLDFSCDTAMNLF